ncbi:MAG: Omp28 family outer membrane lipoprotein, partial [Bacteroidales bacterium]|nr:Omp28 family outer membrane lipoprotein [Bacteroidales bacterium]
MRTFNKIILFLGIIILAFLACDEIEEPFIEYNGQCGDVSLSIPIKQILIEEFTGHECGNCPEGVEMLETLKELYCDHVIPVAIHAGFFAEVSTYGEKYTYEYRTEDGDEIDTYFEASSSGVPNGMINRKKIENDLTQIPENWPVVVAEMLLEKPVLDININTITIIDSRELEVNVDLVFIEAMNDNLMLSIYFLEDSVVSWQKDYSLPDGEQDIEFYSHNHVLRDAVNGTWGDQILNGQINPSDVKSKTYNYIINQDWVIENSSIVAFVYKNDTKEV